MSMAGEVLMRLTTTVSDGDRPLRVGSGLSQLPMEFQLDA